MPHGKICYVEMPAQDAAASAAFYSKIFGWNVRTRGDGETAFDDATGGVSGTWVKQRGDSTGGMLTYIMVDSIEDALRKIAAAGGKVLKPYTAIGGGAGFAIFRDPGGNRVGLYEEPAK